MDEFEDLIAGLNWRRLACILTPVASAQALAGLASLSGLNVQVTATSTGAAAWLELTQAPDPLEELGGEPPAAADHVAGELSRLTHTPVVLLVSNLNEPDSGTMGAWKYEEGQRVAALSPGLVLSGVDAQVEEVLLGVSELDETLSSADLPRWKALRMFARGLKKKKP